MRRTQPKLKDEVYKLVLGESISTLKKDTFLGKFDKERFNFDDKGRSGFGTLKRKCFILCVDHYSIHHEVTVLCCKPC